MSYLATTADVYRQAAQEPQVGLCCTTNPVWQLPGLRIPQRMLAMNYGCGSIVNPRDLTNSPTVLSVGVGGGMELLQFAYFSQRPGAVIGVDVVPEMLTAARENLQEYLDLITEVGFGTVEVRARWAYRVLSPQHYATQELLYIESVEVCAIKDPMPADGPCVFTGRTAIYYGQEEYLDDHQGHTLLQNQPLAVRDKTANALLELGQEDIFVSPATYFYDGGSCC